MKKLNNKGFAITTIVYGLAIMSTMILALVMSLLATTRKDNNNLSKEIEAELNRFSKTSIMFDVSTTGQEFFVPEGEAGWYRIELWGAQGGGANGGLGAYTSGIIKLEEGDILYFVVGKQGADNIGGESTDVRIENTNSATSEATRIMVAAGGGANPGSAGGTLVGYTSSMLSSGGMIKANEDYDLVANTTLLGYTVTGATTTFGTSIVTQSGTPSGNVVDNNPGGEGYFTSTYPEYGGVSFISGYAGSKAYVGGTLTNSAKYTYPGNGRDYYFVDGVMYPGVKTGNGQAKIERVASTENVTALPRQNPKLNGITAVRDCISSTNPVTNINSIAVSVEGETHTNTPTNPLVDSSAGGYVCRTLNLGTSVNADEVAVFHNPGYDYKGHIIEVHNANGWQKIKGRATNYDISETETATGIRISAYQPDFTTTIPKSGNYYIMPVTAEAKVVSGFASSEDRANPLQINSLVGEVRQKWSLEKLNVKLAKDKDNPNEKEYKIVELTRYNALTIYRDENMEGNPLIVSPFNNLARNEPSIWEVTPMGDGTVTITSSAPCFTTDKVTGNVFVQTNPTITDNYNTLIIGVNYNKTQRFKLIKLDF